MSSNSNKVELISSHINRTGETGRIPVRADRYYSAQGEWYFSTREGTPIGPFDGKEDAQNGLKDFIEFMDLAEPKTLSRLYTALQQKSATG